MDLQKGKVGPRESEYRVSEGDSKRRGRREKCHEDLDSDAHSLVPRLGGTGFCTDCASQSRAFPDCSNFLIVRHAE